MTLLLNTYVLKVFQEVPMSNLKDIETLETLSLEEMEQVVGGRGRDLEKLWGKVRRKWFNCSYSNIVTTQVVGGVDFDIGDLAPGEIIIPPPD